MKSHVDLAENKSLRQILDWIKLNHSTTFIFNPKWNSDTKSPCHVMSYSGGLPQLLLEVIGVTDESCSTSSPTWSLEAAGGCCWSCRGMLGSTSNQRYPKFESVWPCWPLVCSCHPSFKFPRGPSLQESSGFEPGTSPPSMMLGETLPLLQNYHPIKRLFFDSADLLNDQCFVAPCLYYMSIYPNLTHTQSFGAEKR